MELTRGALVLLLALGVSGCGQPEDFESEIGAWRADKDAYMRSSDSPVEPAERRDYPPLNYYPVQQDYRVPAALKLVESKDILELPTSQNLRRQMRRIGYLQFRLKGELLTLTAFMDAAEPDRRRLFVPFGDLTNGNETYTGGRYLDLSRTATDIYDLDFNRAYLPFCVYNPKYDCPLPPRENRMKTFVRAGERMPH
ncbi:MAG: DUF1684 domain-containing protein [Acidobacteria bacterium]|nr:DUF1684 domain-containing protein [Acidobacteriota bacterium]